VGKPTTNNFEGLVSRNAVKSERRLVKMVFGFGSADVLDEDQEDALTLLQVSSDSGKKTYNHRLFDLSSQVEIRWWTEERGSDNSYPQVSIKSDYT
jgi:hypothetical protein